MLTVDRAHVVAVDAPSGVLPVALANLEMSEDAIAQFACDYGFLGVEQSWLPNDDSYLVGEGEQFKAWVEAVTVFRIVFNEVNGKGRDNSAGEGFELEALAKPFAHGGRFFQLYRWEIVATDICGESIAGHALVSPDFGSAGNSADTTARL